MKAIVLLSGGLDSVVSMLLARNTYELELALTFDYGQIAKEKEINAARTICEQYNINHKIIEIPFMKDMNSNLQKGTVTDVNSAWVPNRNGLFINIAACYAEAYQLQYIVCGFNAEEAEDFLDNSTAFIKSINHSLSYSTKSKVQVISFVQDLRKEEIVLSASKLGVKFSDIWSCYLDEIKHCGVCPSCEKNKIAFEKAGVDFI